MKENKEKKTTKQVTYAVGDQVDYLGKTYKIVELRDNGDFHLKNVNEPYDSFLTVLPVAPITKDSE